MLYFIRRYDKIKIVKVLFIGKVFIINMKSKIFKLIFILSFIPYVFVIYSILFGKYTANGIELNGIERLSKIIILKYHHYTYATPIIPTCLTFQMCYIFRKNSKVMFMCSFIPYFFALLLSLQYAIFGGRFLGETLHYGWNGFIIGIFGIFVYYVIDFPILPICLIFQIGYIIKTKKQKKHI